MKARLFTLGLLLCTSSIQAAPPPAGELIAKAGVRAIADGKAIYVHFGASWCGWCQKHDTFLEQPAIKPVFEKYFVPVKIVVQESEKNKGLENLGGETLLEKFGGPSGLPFSAFLDAKGALIVNSKRVSEKAPQGENIGHPFAPEEIDWFIVMMKKAAPKMTVEDLKTIETALRAQKK